MKADLLICILLSATIFVSGGCGGKSGSPKAVSSSTSTSKSDESSAKSQYLAENVLVKMDSLVAEMGRLGNLPIVTKMQNGEFVLTEKEKMVKPDYLLDISEVNSFHTLRQKYCGAMVYGVDMNVAELYQMPSAEEYRQTVSKLTVDIDNQALAEFVTGGRGQKDAVPYKNAIRKMYDEELARGRVDLFWNMMVASVVEGIFVSTQNIDKFIVCFDDRTAAETTKRISKCREAIEELIPYHPEMENLYMVLEPLYTLDAHNVAGLTSELYRLRDDISRIRGTILSD